jgi:uncharacterized coiled-coil DUF342 family protein
MDIVQRLRNLSWQIEMAKVQADRREAADEIERLREALETFANNVKETNEGIDENWSKTVYPLKAENQRLREESKVNWVAFQKAADEIVRLREALESFLCECETEDDCCAIGGSFCGWVARAALKGDE